MQIVIFFIEVFLETWYSWDCWTYSWNAPVPKYVELGAERLAVYYYHYCILNPKQFRKCMVITIGIEKLHGEAQKEWIFAKGLSKYGEGLLPKELHRLVSQTSNNFFAKGSMYRLQYVEFECQLDSMTSGRKKIENYV